MKVRSYAKFEEKLTLGSKNNMRKLLNFNATSGKSEHLDWCATFVESMSCLSQTSTEELCRQKWLKKWFQKWHNEFGEFSHKYFEVMLDKSSVCNVLAEGMYSQDKSSPSDFNL